MLSGGFPYVCLKCGMLMLVLESGVQDVGFTLLPLRNCA